MVIKCKKSLNHYKYLIMFDLASHNSGICVWDIANQRPLMTYCLVANKSDGSFVYNLYQQLSYFFFNVLSTQSISLTEVFVSKEAMPVQLRGGSSTVQTFIAMAKAHAVLDLFLEANKIDVYDYVGVYPASTHAYLKKVLNLDSKAFVDKKDVKKYITETYHIETDTLDESDAVFLALTLINSKWNKDIDEEIKEVKRHKKTLKQTRAIQECDDAITALEKLKV